MRTFRCVFVIVRSAALKAAILDSQRGYWSRRLCFGRCIDFMDCTARFPNDAGRQFLDGAAVDEVVS